MAEAHEQAHEYTKSLTKSAEMFETILSSKPIEELPKKWRKAPEQAITLESSGRTGLGKVSFNEVGGVVDKTRVDCVPQMGQVACPSTPAKVKKPAATVKKEEKSKLPKGSKEKSKPRKGSKEKFKPTKGSKPVREKSKPSKATASTCKGLFDKCFSEL